jgi:hypothetical protein
MVLIKHLNLTSKDGRYTLSDVNAWLANGGITSRERSSENSALVRYAPYYANNWQRFLSQWQRDDFYIACRMTVRYALKYYFGHSSSVQRQKCRMTFEQYETRTIDLVLDFIQSFVPDNARFAQDFTTMGDFLFIRYNMKFHTIITAHELKREGVAGIDYATLTPRECAAITRYVQWQRNPVKDPLAWLYEQHYITPRSKQSTVDFHLQVFRALSYCNAKVPHNDLTTLHGKSTHVKGYTLADEIHLVGEPLDEDNEVYLLC